MRKIAVVALCLHSTIVVHGVIAFICDYLNTCSTNLNYSAFIIKVSLALMIV